jgi:UDP-N-acetylglucosamine enolpyruvyl transferase
MLLDEASLTGTANIVMAAVTATGTTTIYNAACEPYIQQLCRMLNQMGARITGIASNLLTIKGDFSEATLQVVYKAGFQCMPADMWEAVCLRGAGAYANPLDSVQERQRASDILLRPYRYTEWQS